MRKVVVLCGATSFIMAFLGGILAFSVMNPTLVAARQNQTEEVRASAFVLVGPDGNTVLARLAPGVGGGGGTIALLSLGDETGRTRLSAGGGGGMQAYDENGTLEFRAGYALDGRPGVPAVNGILLGPEGSIGRLDTQP